MSTDAVIGVAAIQEAHLVIWKISLFLEVKKLFPVFQPSALKQTNGYTSYKKSELMDKGTWA